MPFVYQYFGTAQRYNPDATVNPTANDDNTGGYAIGSRWVNVTTDEEFVCTDATTGAALWKSTTNISATVLAGGTLAGRYTGAGSGAIQQVSLGNNVTMTEGGVLNVSSGTATLGDGDYGDVVVSGSGASITIDADAVDNVKAADMAQGTFKGRASTGSGNPEDLSVAQALTLLGVEAGATADQTGAEIKTAYESEPNTNAFDDAAEAKLAGITPLADVTNATTVAAAGAVMESDTSTALMQFVLDEDSMSSNSATKLATQQSIVAYVTAQVSAALASSMTFKGGYNATTNTPDLDVSPSGVITGDTYVVTVAGTFFTTAVEIGDTLIAEIDSADAESEWTIAQANLSSATIKTQYESNADTNAFTDTEQAKLAGIEALADVTDATNVNAAGAVMESDYNAQTILAATLDNTPAPVTVGEATFVGRSTGGNVAALNATQARTILNVADGAQVNPANMLDADVTTGTDTTPKTSNAAQLKLAAQTWGGGSALSLAASTIAGRGSAAGTGAPVQIALGTNLSMSGTTLNASGGTSSGLTAVATVAALKALTKASLANGDVRLVRSYSTEGDGGDGIWRYNSTSSTTANEGTVIATNEGGNGRWFRLEAATGRMNVRWFGAKGDGTTDDTAAIQAALNTVTHVSSGCPHVTVIMGPGTYRITNTLSLHRVSAKILGLGRGNPTTYANPGQSTFIVWGGTTTNPMMRLQDCIYIEIEDIVFLGNRTYVPSAGVNFYSLTDSGGTNQYIHIKNCYFGAFSWSTVPMNSVPTTPALTAGISFTGDNANNDQFRISNCRFTNCNYGVYLPNTQSIWGLTENCTYHGCAVGLETFASHQVWNMQSSYNTVDIQTNSTAQVYVYGLYSEHSWCWFNVNNSSALMIHGGKLAAQPPEMTGAPYGGHADALAGNFVMEMVQVTNSAAIPVFVYIRCAYSLNGYTVKIKQCDGIYAYSQLDILGYTSAPFNKSYIEIDTQSLKYTGPITNAGFSAIPHRIWHGTAAPVSGTWDRGDIVYHDTPAASGYVGWICVLGGTPGTWKTFGAISA